MIKFFTNRAIVFAVLIIIGLGYFAYKAFIPTNNPEVVSNTIENSNQVPVFTWKFEKAESLNLDGIPRTNIYLEAKYLNENIQRKLIDTVDGGCNDLPDSEKDSLLNSTNIQCYYAGLGFRYKIIKSDTAYQVLRKTFEEGSAEYTPPTFNYEVVSEFPF